MTLSDHIKQLSSVAGLSESNVICARLGFLVAEPVTGIFVYVTEREPALGRTGRRARQGGAGA